MNRSMGVTIAGISAIVAGVLAAAACLLFFGITTVPTGFPTGAMATTWGLILMAAGVLSVVYGFGVLMMRSWSWSTGIVVSIVTALAAAYALWVSAFMLAALITAGIALIAALLSLGYLITGDVRDALHHTGAYGAGSMGHPTPA